MAADLSAVQAYQAAVRAAQQSVGGAKEAEATPSLDFGNMVSSAIADTSGALVTAVSAAEISLETVVAVRDEVVRAYQEILRMPI